MKILNESLRKARKDYYCDACPYVRDSLKRKDEFTISELREIAKAKRNNWKIIKSQEYLAQTQVDSGDIYTVRVIPAIHEICLKYDLYPDF